MAPQFSALLVLLLVEAGYAGQTASQEQVLNFLDELDRLAEAKPAQQNRQHLCKFYEPHLMRMSQHYQKRTVKNVQVPCASGERITPCNKYRVVFEPAVREVTKTVLRGVQRCCKGWKGIRCDESDESEEGPTEVSWEGPLNKKRQLAGSGSAKACSPSCQNSGLCSDGLCFCSPGYTGRTCERAICVPNCLNGGLCVKPNQCVCPSGWTGPRCSKALCAGSCQNGGSCVAPNKCKCKPGYSGVTCETDLCDPSCSNGGSCMAGNCSCASGWSGNRCQTRVMAIEERTILASALPRGALNEPDLCFIWRSHVKSFDGRYMFFPGRCTYKLIHDCQDDLFSVHVFTDPLCKDLANCRRAVNLYLGGLDIKIHIGELDRVTVGDQNVSLPHIINNVVIEKVSGYVITYGYNGITVLWDGKDAVYAHVSTNHRNRTCGLCGNYNGFPDDDVMTYGNQQVSSIAKFGNSWRMTDVNDLCPNVRDEDTKSPCTSVTQGNRTQIQSICSYLHNATFFLCHMVVDPAPFIKMCEEELCKCSLDDRLDCACSAFTQYSRACARNKAPITWRTRDLCPVTCPSTLSFTECGSSCPPTCQIKKRNYICPQRCLDGCHCGNGTVCDGQRCVSVQQCPCVHNKQHFAPNSIIKRDCNNCTCSNGRWICTTLQCPGICSFSGDTHYRTFDGLQFSFMGRCQHILSKDCVNNTFTVVVDNLHCSSGGSVSCTKHVHVHLNGTVIILRGGGTVLIDGNKVADFPRVATNYMIRQLSSSMTSVYSPVGLTVTWDGISRAYIAVQPRFRGMTCGLCGTFNSNQNDDLTTKEHVVETSVSAFGYSWKVNPTCNDTKPSKHPCEMQIQRKAAAEKLCNRLWQAPFNKCHYTVDPGDKYIANCMYDVCGCQQGSQCLCSAIATYVHDCARHGVVIEWMNSKAMPECKAVCDIPGQVYQVCGSSCQRTCREISMGLPCKQECAEGCNCPVGKALRDGNQCVPYSQCPCYRDGNAYDPGTVIKPTNCNKCLCKDARFVCTNRTCAVCPVGQKWVACGAQCAKTCDNFHLPCLDTKCREGCVCPEGTVLHGQRCVNSSQCLCHHGGHSYRTGQKIKVDCNTCSCKGTQWSCTSQVCPGTCSVYGELNYITFDRRRYTFSGPCEYVLVQDSCNGSSLGTFQIQVQNVPCGGSGLTCTKKMSIIINNTVIVLEKEKIPVVFPLPGSVDSSVTTSFQIRELHFFTVLQTEFGLTITWDRGTRLYITLDSKFTGRTCGLCGNFNGDRNDDFMTPQMLPETLANDFGDSWKVESTCPDAIVPRDPCATNKHRAPWAHKMCSVIRRDVFKPCHDVVDPAPWYDACYRDACACDSGGDCECLCTAVAAYGHECCKHGVSIKWRTQELCPIQCPHKEGSQCSEYTACDTGCPKTCESLCDATLAGCPVRLEGCSCPNGTVFSKGQCISPRDCPCHVGGVDYNPGSIIVKNCQRCLCESGCLSCTGPICKTPGTTSPEITTITTLGGPAMSTAKPPSSPTPPPPPLPPAATTTTPSRTSTTINLTGTTKSPGTTTNKLKGTKTSSTTLSPTTNLPREKPTTKLPGTTTTTAKASEPRKATSRSYTTETTKSPETTTSPLGTTTITTKSPETKTTSIKTPRTTGTTQSPETTTKATTMTISKSAGVTTATTNPPETTSTTSKSLRKTTTSKSPKAAAAAAATTTTTTGFIAKAKTTTSTTATITTTTSTLPQTLSQKITKVMTIFKAPGPTTRATKSQGTTKTILRTTGTSTMTLTSESPRPARTKAASKSSGTATRTRTTTSKTLSSTTRFKAPETITSLHVPVATTTTTSKLLETTTPAAKSQVKIVPNVKLKPTTNTVIVPTSPLCPQNKVYVPCKSRCEETCQYMNNTCTLLTTSCYPGCQCPDGTVFNGTRCVRPGDCICFFNGTYYDPGSTWNNTCERCWCWNNSIICRDIRCPPLPHCPSDNFITLKLPGECCQTCVRRNDSLCLPHNVRCNDGRCITKHWLCDGQDDCKDGEDERNCTDVSACFEPLGLSSNSIPDNFFRASSSVDVYYRPGEGRLNNSHIVGRGSGAWCAEPNDEAPYLQVNLGSVRKVTQVSTQGHPVLHKWVTLFRLAYSVNGVTWIKLDKMFQGNSNQSTVVSNKLPQPILLQYIRVYPVDWYMGVCLRLEVYGCAVGVSTPFTPTTPRAPVICPEFRCQNGKCITQSLRCDGDDDCGDDSDEVHCGNDTCKEFRCSNNSKCISFKSLCDGQQDCPQGEDEEHCPTSLSTTGPQTNITMFNASITQKPSNMTLISPSTTGPQENATMAARASPTPETQTTLVHSSPPSQVTTNASSQAVGHKTAVPSTSTPAGTTTSPSAMGVCPDECTCFMSCSRSIVCPFNGPCSRCTCSNGTIIHANRCVVPMPPPCLKQCEHNGQKFQVGTSIQDGLCHVCTCRRKPNTLDQSEVFCQRTCPQTCSKGFKLLIPQNTDECCICQSLKTTQMPPTGLSTEMTSTNKAQLKATTKESNITSTKTTSPTIHFTNGSTKTSNMTIPTSKTLPQETITSTTPSGLRSTNELTTVSNARNPAAKTSTLPTTLPYKNESTTAETTTTTTNVTFPASTQESKKMSTTFPTLHSTNGSKTTYNATRPKKTSQQESTTTTPTVSSTLHSTSTTKSNTRLISPTFIQEATTITTPKTSRFTKESTTTPNATISASTTPTEATTATSTLPAANEFTTTTNMATITSPKSKQGSPSTATTTSPTLPFTNESMTTSNATVPTPKTYTQESTTSNITSSTSPTSEQGSTTTTSTTPSILRLTNESTVTSNATGPTSRIPAHESTTTSTLHATLGSTTTSNKTIPSSTNGSTTTSNTPPSVSFSKESTTTPSTLLFNNATSPTITTFRQETTPTSTASTLLSGLTSVIPTQESTITSLISLPSPPVPPGCVWSNCSCSMTCADLAEPAVIPCTTGTCSPGWKCSPSLVLLKDKWVSPVLECPCYHNSTFYKTGEKFENGTCSSCMCLGDSVVCTQTCNIKSCPVDEELIDEPGKCCFCRKRQTALPARNLTTANTIKSVQTTSSTSTLLKIITPKAITVTAKETTPATTYQATNGETSTHFMETTSQPKTTATILTATTKPNVSAQASTESVTPTTGVKIEPCRVQTEDKDITDKFGCSSTQPVHQTSCEGFCKSRSLANVSTPLVNVECFCCKPNNLSEASVPMKCPDGVGKRVFKYVIITDCSCASCESTDYQAKLRTVVGGMLGNATKLADSNILN